MIIFLFLNIIKVNKLLINISINNISFKYLIKILIKDITFIIIKKSIFYKLKD